MTGDGPDLSPPPPAGLTLRYAAATDLPAIGDLYERTLASLDPALMARESDTFFEAHVARSGRILCVFDGAALAAYGVLGLPRATDPSFGADLGLTEADLAKVAQADGVAVDPTWRGRGLHRLLLTWRVTLAAEFGRGPVLSTVAPANLPSLRNMLAAGFAVRALKRKFGGHWRFILQHGAAPDAGAEMHLPLSDLSAIGAALASGAVGIRVVQMQGGAESLLLRYGSGESRD